MHVGSNESADIETLVDDFVTFYIGGRAFSLLLLSTLVVGHSLFCYFLHWWFGILSLLLSTLVVGHSLFCYFLHWW